MVQRPADTAQAGDYSTVERTHGVLSVREADVMGFAAVSGLCLKGNAAPCLKRIRNLNNTKMIRVNLS